MIKMKERRYVKLRSDMYEDTKFKIIDMKPERDMIHYVWTRLLTLAGKVNLDGDLFMSRNLPYTIETLAIEFNRSEAQIKVALDVFLELEMMELIEGSIYRVKNFVKHQNIKVKEKVKSEDNTIVITKKTEAAIKATSASENYIDEVIKTDSEETTVIKNDDKGEQEINNNEINKGNKIVNNSVEDKIPISIETRKNKKKNEGEFNITDEEKLEDNEIISFTEGERSLGEGERIILEMTF